MSSATHNPFTGNGDYWWYRVKANILEKFFGNHVKADDLVLDIGSADGPAVKFIESRLGPKGKKTAMDIESEGLGEDDILGSVEDIPVESGSFDIVSAFDVIEHVKNEAKGLDEIFRVLKPGGHVFISVPAYQWAWSKHDEELHHYRRYTRGRLEVAVRQAGFVEAETSYGFFGTFPIFALQRLKAKLTRTYSGEIPSVTAGQEKILLNLSRLDTWAIKAGLPLPWGSSVLLKARKPE